MNATHQFTYTPDADNPHDHMKVGISTDAEHLVSVLSAMEAYLKACGFCFEGHLDIVEEDVG